MHKGRGRAVFLAAVVSQRVHRTSAASKAGGAHSGDGGPVVVLLAVAVAGWCGGGVQTKV